MGSFHWKIYVRNKHGTSNFFLLETMLIMLRQVWDVFIRLVTVRENGENSLLDSIHQNPSCFCTNFEYSKIDKANNLIIRLLPKNKVTLPSCYVLALCFTFTWFTHRKNGFLKSGNKKGKAIKQKLSSYYLLLDNTSEFWTSPHGPINPLLRPHFTHNENELPLYLLKLVRKVCSEQVEREGM